MQSQEGAAGWRDVIGELQTHLIVYAKGVADTVWEVQQAREYDEQKVRRRLGGEDHRPGGSRGDADRLIHLRSSQVAALRSNLLVKANRLDELIGALPDYPLDTACVPRRAASCYAWYARATERQGARPRCLRHPLLPLAARWRGDWQNCARSRPSWKRRWSPLSNEEVRTFCRSAFDTESFNAQDDHRPLSSLQNGRKRR
jgi:hypothetical protein